MKSLTWCLPLLVLAACEQGSQAENGAPEPPPPSMQTAHQAPAAPETPPEAAPKSPPAPIRPPDLDHITDPRMRVQAQLDSFRQIMKQTPDNEQKQMVLQQLLPAAQQIIEGVEEDLHDQPERSLIKLDMVQAMVPEDHPMQTRIAELRSKIQRGMQDGDPGKKERGGGQSLAEYLFAHGRKALRNHRSDKAAWAFREALKYDPGHVGAVEELKRLENKARMLYEEAYVLRQTDPAKARKRLRTVIFMLERDHPYRRKAHDLWLKLERRALTRRRTPGPNASTPPPDPNAPARQQGIALHKQRRLDEAMAKYRQALKENPKDYDLYRLMGAACALKGDKKKAYAHYKEYVERCPECMYAPSVKKILRDYEKN